MPNIKSAKKRVKVNKTKAAANKSRKSNLKTVLKKADAACAAGAADKA
ncbi:MAG: 30S ribosomal protein S20, partial [Ruminococcus sp.]|nr:30S ribosomal protein S20 [Ruminococcus sp.]